MRLNKNFCFALAVIAGVTLDDAARSQELSHAATKTNDRHSGLSRQAERRSSSSNQFRGKKRAMPFDLSITRPTRSRRDLVGEDFTAASMRDPVAARHRRIESQTSVAGLLAHLSACEPSRRGSLFPRGRRTCESADVECMASRASSERRRYPRLSIVAIVIGYVLHPCCRVRPR